jgi:hypothetical protein
VEALEVATDQELGLALLAGRQRFDVVGGARFAVGPTARTGSVSGCVIVWPSRSNSGKRQRVVGRSGIRSSPGGSASIR